MDLVVIVPDADWEQTIRVLLGDRSEAIGIRRISFEVIRHPERDPGVRANCSALLRPFAGRAEHAMVCFDFEGSGAPTVEDARATVQAQIAPYWDDHRSSVVIVEPELESWVWSRSAHVAGILGWNAQDGPVRSLIHASGLWPADMDKPSRPKEAMEMVMRRSLKRRSPAVFGDLSRRVSLNGCADPSFAIFRNALVDWFPT